MATRRKKPGPKPRLKSELQRSKLAVMLTDAERKRFEALAQAKGKRAGTLARDILKAWMEKAN